MEVLTTKVQDNFDSVPDLTVISKSSLIDGSTKIKSIQFVDNTKLAVINANTKILIKHNELDQALVLATQALNIKSDHELSLNLLAQIFQNKNQFDHKIKTLHALIAIHPRFEYYAQLGHAYYRQENYDFAENFYILCLSKNIHDEVNLFEVYKNLGNIQVMKKDYEAAEENYHKAFTIKPNSDQLFVNLGTLEIQKNQFDNAKQKFQDALRFNPKNTGAWTGLAMIHNHMSDFELAKANVLKAIDIDQGHRVAVHLAAQWFYRDADFKKAELILQNFLATCDVDVEMSLVLIHVLSKMEKFQEALLEMERLILWDPSRKEFYEIEKELKNKLKDQVEL